MNEPDELIMRFKWNVLEVHDSANPYNATFPAFGIAATSIPSIHNFSTIAAKYKQVEFLSGRTTLTIFNNYTEGTTSASTTALCVWRPYRVWVDSKGAASEEIIMPNGSSKVGMWEQTAELPGTKYCYITSRNGQKNVKKLSFRFTQKSFKQLRADPTSFSMQLPIDPEATPQMPLNRAYIKFCMDASDATTSGGRLEIFVAHTIYAKFKGRLAD